MTPLARLICLSLVLGFSMLTMGKSPSSLAGTVTLNETQQRDLRLLGMPVLLPTYLPPGFQLAEVKILQEGMKGYAILFESANNGCFLVEATNGGIGGGIELESTLPITAKLLGEGYALNYGLPKDLELRQQFPEADLYSDWMKLDRYFYRLSGALMAREEYDYANCRQDIAPAEAVKVIESLRDSR
jgi:hypothetical protein